MKLKFEKWHGCRNDFIVCWLPENDQLTRQALRSQAENICARDGGGVGADGIILLHPQNKDDLFPRRLLIINSDGSLAATCGNGLRCAALSTLNAWRERGNPHNPPDGIEFEIHQEEGSAPRQVFCRYVTDRKLQPGDRLWPMVSVDMGEVVLGPGVRERQLAFSLLLAHAETLGIKQKLQSWEVCELGNLHLVVWSDEASQVMARQLGPLMQTAPDWDGINLHLIKPRTLENPDKARIGRLFKDLSDDGFAAWTWERGAGETQACGSGACAIVAVAGIQGDYDRKDWVSVQMPGGMLLARWDDGRMTLAGPGELVFTGSLEF